MERPMVVKSHVMFLSRVPKLACYASLWVEEMACFIQGERNCMLCLSKSPNPCSMFISRVSKMNCSFWHVCPASLANKVNKSKNEEQYTVIHDLYNKLFHNHPYQSQRLDCKLV